MKLGNWFLVGSAVLAILLFAAPISADQSAEGTFCPATAPEMIPNGTNIRMVGNEKSAYAGTLRIYIVEKRSRYTAYDNHPYEMGFLEFAAVEPISMPDGGRFEDEYEWYGGTSGFAVNETNVFAIAVLFDDAAHPTDAYPPDGYNFNAYYVDAAAGASPGEIASSYVGPGWTHSVFIEEATAHWCSACPTMRDLLGTMYDDPDMHFYFVALVDDRNDDAHDRIFGDLNLGAWPTTFFDGGDAVHVGNMSGSQATFTSTVASVQNRNNAGIQLMTGVDWISNSRLMIHVAIGNEVSPNYAPTATSVVSGVTSGFKDSTYAFEAHGSDPDTQELWYMWDWGDGTVGDWIGPYDAGTNCALNYTYTDTGLYAVRVKSRDYWGEETAWSNPWDIYISKSGCCVGEFRGNVDGDPYDLISLGDLTVMIDVLFISLSDPDCFEEANLDGSLPEGEGSISLGDLTALIDILFISLDNPPLCP